MNRVAPEGEASQRTRGGAGDRRGFSPAGCGRGGWYARGLSTVIVDKPRSTEHGSQPEQGVKRRGGGARKTRNASSRCGAGFSFCYVGARALAPWLDLGAVRGERVIGSQLWSGEAATLEVREAGKAERKPEPLKRFCEEPSLKPPQEKPRRTLRGRSEHRRPRGKRGTPRPGAAACGEAGIGAATEDRRRAMRGRSPRDKD